MSEQNIVQTVERKPELRRYMISLEGNDIFAWSKVIEARSFAGAVNDAIQIIDGLTIEQIVKVEGDLLPLR